jgi:hypothetical protein
LESAGRQLAVMIEGPGKTIGTIALVVHLPLGPLVTLVELPESSSSVSIPLPPVLKYVPKIAG